MKRRVQHLTRVYAVLSNRFFKSFNAPPRAAGVLTSQVGVATVLKLQVKAKPVHALLHFVMLPGRIDGFPTPNAE